MMTRVVVLTAVLALAAGNACSTSMTPTSLSSMTPAVPRGLSATPPASSQGITNTTLPPLPPFESERLARETSLADAEAAWQQRHDPRALVRAVRMWEQALAAQPDHPTTDLLLRLARAKLLLAEYFLLPRAARREALAALEQAVRASERALLREAPALQSALSAGFDAEEAIAALDARALPSAYWYATSLAHFALNKDLSAVVFYHRRIRALLTRVTQLDQGHLRTAAHRTLATFFATAPSIAGGDLAKAKEHFERCLTLDATDIATRVRYAELYALPTGQRDLFVRLLANAPQARDASGQPGAAPSDVGERRIDRDRARTLLSETNEFFGSLSPPRDAR